MKQFPTLHTRFFSSPILPFMGIVVFVAVTLLLIVLHIGVVQTLQMEVFPLTVGLPSLERRARVLEEQVELVEIRELTELQPLDENLHMFVLPRGPSLSRALASVELLRDTLGKQHNLFSMSPVRVGEVKTLPDGVAGYPLSWEMELTQEGWRESIVFLAISGLLTVGDLFHPQERSLLLEHAESENPAGIVALEMFLSSDLLRYAQDSRAFDEQLQRAFTSPVFESISHVVGDGSLFSEAKRLLDGEVGHALQGELLWPMQFTSLERMGITFREEGRVRLSVELLALSRT